MKYYTYLAAVLMLTACTSSSKLELTLNASNIRAGKLILTQYNEQVFTQSIKDGEATIDMPVQTPGYYQLTIIDEAKPLSDKRSFTIYLEDNKYKIDLEDPGSSYPQITSTSKTQQELSDYYKLENKMAGTLNHTIDSLLAYIDTREAKALPPKERTALINKTRGYQIKRRKLEPKILMEYVSKNPNSKAAAHIIAEQYIDEYAQEYATIYSKLSEEAKSTDDAIKVANKVSVLSKLVAGSIAPEITGTLPNGKLFNKESLKGKLVLVEFWKAGSEVISRNHAKMANGLILTASDRPKFAMVSVSLDNDKAAWNKAIIHGKPGWVNVSDFKGDQSPNVTNWQIKAVPVYYLLDENWKVLKAGIDLIDVDQAVHDYLK
ncbi:TlpA family protein disulfide reductase [Mucilaginibacter litoreus]|uniref:TlpA family protein disulfide reductase n=1 Tax=Mucilaginibacter litoreus TaxID=1048221 RepID=A0ABW3AWN8_9SPHI